MTALDLTIPLSNSKYEIVKNTFDFKDNTLQLLFEQSRIRSDANIVAHHDDRDKIAEDILSLQFISDRESLSGLFAYCVR